MTYKTVKISPKGRFRKFDKLIGEGAHKRVYQGYDLHNGIYVAWNEIGLSKLSIYQKRKVRDEVLLLIKVKHKNKHVLNVYNSWFDKDENKVIFITDLFMAGSLKAFINQVKILRLGVIKKWCSEIINGIEFLHENNIIHRDLKCANIFINGTTGNIVVGDFGIARLTSNTGSATTALGTPEFMAPELYEEGKYDKSIDIYSFGMCLLEMVSNEIPYNECQSIPQIWKKVTEGCKPESLDKVENDTVKDLIEICISSDSDNRPTIEEIKSHPFFHSPEIDTLVVEFKTHEDIVHDEGITVEEEIEKSLAIMEELEKDESFEERLSNFQEIDTTGSETAKSYKKIDEPLKEIEFKPPIKSSMPLVDINGIIYPATLKPGEIDDKNIIVKDGSLDKFVQDLNDSSDREK